MSSPVRVRIAPSPTGDPHVGTAYIGLFNYVFAKKHGGQFVLRIEDTDQTRSTKESEAMIFHSLAWAGLTWDEGPDKGGPYGPYRQSERLGHYQEAAQTLIARGEAYRCFCTSERLDALRATQRASGQRLGYDGHCRHLSAEESSKRAADKEAFVIRLKMPDAGKIVVKDELRGEIEFDVAEIDDQVLLKSDGFPTYHLANVVDDHMMKITHVIRAEEWITSTPKHVQLYRAFAWDVPVFVHMPLLRNADKSKISKRKNPVSLNYYERAGYLPEAMLNYLAMMGWTMSDQREKFTVEEMVKDFSFDRISLGGPVFDLQKLTWLNGLYLREQDDSAYLARLREHVFSDAYLKRVIPLVRERVDKLEDFASYAEFFFSGRVNHVAAELLPKGRTAADVKPWLEALSERFDTVVKWDHTALDALLRELCEKLGIKPKDLFMPVRVAVTGRTATPGLFETMEVLGKEVCRTRLRDAIAVLGKA
jgi:glutamyl-tRNA synthetase